ncbi:MAG: acyltransferase [Actinobacteria bacterium]|nr:acyltransferase [Actinomycetota bacterium]MDI6830086.1 acyltransferase [Actinomycetota bacterium]
MMESRVEALREVEKGAQLPAGPGERPRGWRWLVRTLRFIREKRMYGPRYWLFLYRFLRFKLLHPRVKTEGFIFLPRRYQVVVKKGASMRIGRWVWIGTNNALRCHEGELYIGDNTIFGTDNTVNCYAGVYIGPECLFADSVYIVDFDHNYWDPVISIRSQGITKRPIRLEGDIWVGEKVSILRGVTVGRGSVIGAMSLVNRDVPPYAVVGGVPARVLGWRPRPVPDDAEREGGGEGEPPHGDRAT